MTQTRSVVMERQFPYPPERIWRALTQPELIEQWLMKTDFQLELGRGFTLRGDWGSVACKVLEIEPQRTLKYQWDANGLESVVTWTLDPSPAGTILRMEQSGFPADREDFYQGAKSGWPHFLDGLARVVARVSVNP